MKRTIKFNLFPKKVGGVLVECRPIRMRVCYAGYRVDFRVGYSIEPEKWNEEEGRVISNTKNRFRQTAGEINKAITAFLRRTNRSHIYPVRTAGKAGTDTGRT
jgi:hypothetical protein